MLKLVQGRWAAGTFPDPSVIALQPRDRRRGAGARVPHVWGTGLPGGDRAAGRGDGAAVLWGGLSGGCCGPSSTSVPATRWVCCGSTTRDTGTDRWPHRPRTSHPRTESQVAVLSAPRRPPDQRACHMPHRISSRSREPAPRAIINVRQGRQTRRFGRPSTRRIPEPSHRADSRGSSPRHTRSRPSFRTHHRAPTPRQQINCYIGLSYRRRGARPRRDTSARCMHARLTTFSLEARTRTEAEQIAGRFFQLLAEQPGHRHTTARLHRGR